MSGGFFRGTSADQDTRFSNKMSKLLKSQKFAPELDVAVEMSKVKIDVIKPWIATRVTELLGFEDEVLINFIYGLLDVKEADGKHLQIQLTGFMEKNTGRFMKELWGLLTSAQNNMSGVPQQFLDARAEEAKKKKDEKERILAEVQHRKEEQEKGAEEERQRKLSAREESFKANLENRGTMGSPAKGDGEKAPGSLDDQGGKNGRDSRKLSRSPASPSSSPSRGPLPSRQRRPRSISRSPRRGRRSGSPFRRRSPIQRRLLTGRASPRFRSRSPPRNSRRSPISFYSPPRRHLDPWSPPLKRRSQSGSLSPVLRRRSPYVRRGSPSKDRVRRRSKSPFRRRRSFSREHVRHSRSPPKRRSSFNKGQAFRQSRSSPRRRRSLSRDQITRQSMSPVRRKSLSSEHVTVHSKSPLRSRDSLSKEPVAHHSRSPARRPRSSSREHAYRQTRSPRSPPKKKSSSREQVVRHRSPHVEREVPSRERGIQQIRSPPRNRRSLGGERGRRNGFDGRDGSRLDGENGRLERVQKRSDRPDKRDLPDQRLSPSGERVRLPRKDWSDSQPPGSNTDGEERLYRDFDERSNPETIKGIDAVKRTVDWKEIQTKMVTESDEDDAHLSRSQAVLKKVEVDGGVDEDDSDSPGSSEGRLANKRRRKEEKRHRKEEKQKRREERRRRKEKKLAGKITKVAMGVDVDLEELGNNLLPVDYNHHGQREVVGKADAFRSKGEETEDEQKRIERELRNKALESLRAKKGIL